MPIRRDAVALVALAALAVGLKAAPQSRPDACALAIQNPADVSVQLSLKNGQKRFREGEIIELSLGFASTTRNTYDFDAANYDRSGRLDTETVCVEPSGARDPLDDYFRSGLFTVMSGGLRGIQVLSARPAVVDLDLNEWKTLSPGPYRVRVTSSRVSRRAAAGAPGRDTPVPLVSNAVEIEVVPASSDWQAARFQAAIAAIDRGADEPAKRRGARALRFLDSEASTRELARRYWSVSDQPLGSEFMFGLIASSHRQAAIDTLKGAIADPAHPISQQVVETLALLEMQSDPRYQLPAYSGAPDAAWSAARDVKMVAYRVVVARHLGELSAALDTKIGQARAISLNTLLMNPGAADATRLRPMLVASWDLLPVRLRNEILTSRWDQVGGAELLPILRGIVAGPPNRPNNSDQPNRGAALVRLFAIAPAEGRELILREIRNIQGDIGISVLGRLPDRELPEVDDSLLARVLQRNVPFDAQVVAFDLVARYATGKALAQMQGLYQLHRGNWACALQGATLRYLLRIDQPYGVAQIADSLQRRAITGCYQGTFSNLQEAVALPDIERLAIAALDDVSPEVVRDASEALGRYGSAAAEAPLWRRLEKLHKDGSVDGNMVEYGLMNALTGGQAWFCDVPKLERLRSLVTPSRQSELDRGMIAEWQGGQLQLSMSWYIDRLSYSLGAYTGFGIESLVKKLKQFPAATHVILLLPADLAAHHQSEIAAVQQAAVDTGVVLEIRR